MLQKREREKKRRAESHKKFATLVVFVLMRNLSNQKFAFSDCLPELVCEMGVRGRDSPLLLVGISISVAIFNFEFILNLKSLPTLEE